MDVNSSLLSILSIEVEGIEHIFFMYVKEIHEKPPEAIHWYKGRGEDGKAQQLWTERKIRQWLAIGKSPEIKIVFDQLMCDQSWTMVTLKGTSVTFQINQYNRVSQSDDELLARIPGVNPSTPPAVLYYQTDFDPSISFLVDEHTNCRFIDGTEYHQDIKPIYPSGLLGENKLYEYLKEKIIAVYEPKEIFFQMAESKNTALDKKITGFIQSDKVFRTDHYVNIQFKDGSESIGKADIDPVTGRWEISVEETYGKGRYLVINRKTGRPTFGENYFIIQNMTFSDHVARTILTDLFGRQIILLENGSGETSPPVDALNWDYTLYPDATQAEIELSDKIASVLLSLGRSIVISDPYFLGDLKEVDKKWTFASTGQRLFFNALITAIGKGVLREITLVGNWGRANSYVEGSQTDFERRYQMLAALIQGTFKSWPDKQLDRFEMVFTKGSFHDRY
ncbi:hypothetical protein [Chitinophaga sp. Ak27]|uniref:hypothetical protein n=1 Tax=Chitinophaga sp. Ak27 TaxID=2726116 RepID=UPI00145D99F4|nr:hypothetical protein [Chitinophaga sp. Ak27]NLU92305.1 hypothetical protein [Chitinophaga sp. Ak27]